MKITCACGIDYQVYDYPPAEVEEGGKKMMERHIMCPCDREVVVRTAPKYEPASQEENVSGVISFDELVRRLNQDPPPPPAPVTPPAGWGGWGSSTPTAPPKAAPKAVVAPSLPSPIIVDPNAAPVVTNQEKSIFLSKDDAEVLGALVAHYGQKFKDAEIQKDEVQEFAELAVRAAQDGMFIVYSDREDRMIRMAFLEKNVKKLWPVGQFDDDTDFNVVQTARAKDLRERFKNLCGWDK